MPPFSPNSKLFNIYLFFLNFLSCIKDSIFEYKGLGLSSSHLEKIISDLLKDFYVGAAYTHVYAVSNGRNMKGYNNFSIMLYRLNRKI